MDARKEGNKQNLEKDLNLYGAVFLPSARGMCFRVFFLNGLQVLI